MLNQSDEVHPVKLLYCLIYWKSHDTVILFHLTFSSIVQFHHSWTSNVVDKSIQEFCGQWPSWSASCSVSVGICVCPHLSLPFLLCISLHAAVGLPKRPGLKREHLLYYNTWSKWHRIGGWGVEREGEREREKYWQVDGYKNNYIGLSGYAANSQSVGESVSSPWVGLIKYDLMICWATFSKTLYWSC